MNKKDIKAHIRNQLKQEYPGKQKKQEGKHPGNIGGVHS